MLGHYTPFIIWNGYNSLIDLHAVIEDELAEMMANERVEVIKLRGRNGSLHQSLGDYDSFDYSIEMSIPYEKIHSFKKIFRGSGKLITYNDVDKYRLARVVMSKPIEFENEWGVFYKFEVNFDCQPFRYKVVENTSLLNKGENTIINPGDIPSYPYFEFMSSGGDITIEIENNIFTLLNTQAGLITLDSEKGLAIFDGSIVKTRGTYNGLKLNPGKNLITIDGNIKSATIVKRSAWL
ncbi:phage tail protein [Carnobacterium divergens]|uniref:phage tail protein n=1 Tax=Carnobacterium divergens TaxID=2748 RepID=UPI0039BE1064